MELPTLVRRVIVVYLATIGFLGLGTATWAVQGLLSSRSMVVGRL